MKTIVRSSLRVVLATILVAMGLVATTPGVALSAQRSSRAAQGKRTTPPATPYDQGYRKGYSDGYAQGGTDWRQTAARDYENSQAWEQRESRFDNSSEEYRQGYELGFELGYTDGYYGRARNATVPANGAVLAKAAALANAQRNRADNPPPQDVEQTRPREATQPRRTGSVNVPDGTQMRIKLTSPISTKTNRVGDRFTAEVLLPTAYERATIEGHISTLDRSGRVSGRTELGFMFDTITMPDGRQGKLAADLERVIESENVKKVDEEGRIETGSKSRDSQVRGGVGAAAGAIIGGIAGGAKGAILGAIIGGAAGVGTVYIEGNKDLILDPGTEMVIRTVGPSSR
ncbi:MAG TPA: hypothetical protein VJH03_27015 [Blastocatellia bacterium]|nr:hypothetical protein [Blastocatellia bacterium]